MPVPVQLLSLRIAFTKVKSLWPILLVIGAYSALAMLLPLKQAVLIGPDEGFELLKGSMVAQGFELYTAIWNDQPPLFTLLLGCVFKLLGTSALFARAVTVGFVYVLLASLFSLCKDQEKPLTQCLFGVLLICAPMFLALGMSAMLELPALSLGYLSACLLLNNRNLPLTISRVLLSGLIFGSALMVKLTAVMLLPGILVGLIVRQTPLFRQDTIKRLVKHCMLWVMGAGIFVGLTLYLCPGLTVSMLINDHFGSRVREIIGVHPGAHFNAMTVLVKHREAVVALPAALILSFLTNKLHNIVFPLTNLMVALVVF